MACNARAVVFYFYRSLQNGNVPAYRQARYGESHTQTVARLYGELAQSITPVVRVVPESELGTLAGELRAMEPTASTGVAYSISWCLTMLAEMGYN
jgi:hypothetical protein